MRGDCCLEGDVKYLLVMKSLQNRLGCQAFSWGLVGGVIFVNVSRVGEAG